MSADRPPLTGEDMVLAQQGREMARTGAARVLREGAGVTVEDMARAIGASVRSLIRWEHGDVLPRARHGAAWARILRELAQPAWHATNERGSVPDTTASD